MSLAGKIAVVTGASRGVGRGIALQLGEAGAKVYVTGRDPKNRKIDPRLPTLQSTAEEVTKRGGTGVSVYVDSLDDAQLKNLFNRIAKENDGRLDILVNNAIGTLDSDIHFITKNFWEYEPNLWDDTNALGLRGYYVAAVYASRLMAKNQTGLIVNISAKASTGGKAYNFNVPFGIGKAAVDRMATDMARELKPHNVAMVSLWPAGVNTEIKEAKVDDGSLGAVVTQRLKTLAKSDESAEFSGKAILALYSDPKILDKTGKIFSTAILGQEYGFKDIDGREIPASQQLIDLLKKCNM